MRRALAPIALPALGAKVTGSNGKGSTSHLIAAGLAAHGRRVGLYTSPHFLDPCERVQVLGDGDAQPIDADTLWALVAEAAPAAHTRFEALTVAAARFFAAARLDAVVWEAGIGGRHDATRAFNAPVTVLTQVALEHTAILGDTLEAITADKAALTTPGGHLVVGPLPPALVAVAEATLQTEGTPPASLTRVDTAAATALAGPHQAWNAACAREALRLLLGAEYSAERAQEAFATVRVPGRFEQVRRGVWVDAAHELSGLRAALQTAREAFAEPWVLIFGVSADRDVEAMAALATEGAHAVVVTTAHHKGAPLSRVVDALSGAPQSVHRANTPAEALALAMNLAGPAAARPILATGGLFLAAEISAASRGIAPEQLVWF